MRGRTSGRSGAASLRGSGLRPSVTNETLHPVSAASRRVMRSSRLPRALSWLARARFLKKCGAARAATVKASSPVIKIKSLGKSNQTSRSTSLKADGRPPALFANTDTGARGPGGAFQRTAQHNGNNQTDSGWTVPSACSRRNDEPQTESEAILPTLALALAGKPSAGPGEGGLVGFAV